MISISYKKLTITVDLAKIIFALSTLIFFLK